MENLLQIAANIATIFSAVWALIFGGKMLRDVLGTIQKKSALHTSSTNLTNIILASILLVLVVPHTTWITSFPFFTPMGSANASSAADLVLNDTLIGDTNVHHWEVDGDSHGSCFTTDTGYTAQAQQGFFATCSASSTNFSNLIYQVELTIREGDSGGIIFRSNGTNFYYFCISFDGYYALKIAGGNAFASVLKEGSSAAIKTGLNRSNRVKVSAQGSNIELFINGEHVAYVHDGTYTSGQVGVIADAKRLLTTVTFTQAQVWA